MPRRNHCYSNLQMKKLRLERGQSFTQGHRLSNRSTSLPLTSTGARMYEGACLLLGLCKPSWHCVPVVHHSQSLAAGHKVVGASPTFAWRNEPSCELGVLWSGGVAMHRTPLHVLAAMWGIAGGPPSMACPCVYRCGRAPQESPEAHALGEICSCLHSITGSIVHAGPRGSLCPFAWLRAVSSKYSPVG